MYSSYYFDVFVRVDLVIILPPTGLMGYDLDRRDENREREIRAAAVLVAISFVISLFMMYTSPRRIPMLGAMEEIETENDETSRIIHVYFKESSLTDAPLLVFLHGMGGQLAQFQHQFQDLEKKSFAILALDLPGHGFSLPSSGNDTPENFTRSAFCSMARNIIEKKIRKDQRIILVGHSYGCQIAVKLMSMISSHVSGVVLLAPKAQFTETEVKHMQAIKNLPLFVLNLLRFVDKFGGIHSISVKRMLTKSATKEMKELQLAFNATTPTLVVRNTILGMTVFGPEDYSELKRLQVPTLVIGADEDVVTPLSKNVNLVVEWTGVPPSRVKFVKTGHNLMLEEPNLISRLLYDFVQEIAC
jgi:pimeloyl-ACP methyl ester carboxylesterase